MHEQYVLLNIYPVKFKRTIHPEYIFNKRLTDVLLGRHYSYIYGARYYTPPVSYHYHRLALGTFCISYHPHIYPRTHRHTHLFTNSKITLTDTKLNCFLLGNSCCTYKLQLKNIDNYEHKKNHPLFRIMLRSFH